MIDELRAALDPVADAFEALGVSYRVGGSVASSALGIARSTLDVDLVEHGRLPRMRPDALLAISRAARLMSARLTRSGARNRRNNRGRLSRLRPPPR